MLLVNVNVLTDRLLNLQAMWDDTFVVTDVGLICYTNVTVRGFTFYDT